MVDQVMLNLEAHGVNMRLRQELVKVEKMGDEKEVGESKRERETEREREREEREERGERSSPDARAGAARFPARFREDRGRLFIAA